MGYNLIASTTQTSNTAINFTNIPNTFRYLVFMIAPTGDGELKLRFNNVSTSSYNQMYAEIGTSGQFTSAQSLKNTFDEVTAHNDGFVIGEIYNYADTSKDTVTFIRGATNLGENLFRIHSVTFLSEAEITSLNFHVVNASSTYPIRISLFGVS